MWLYNFNNRSFPLEILFKCIPGQAKVLHTALSLLSPTQSFPPWSGVGLSHTLVREFVLPPQVTGHALNLDHSLHPPWTINIEIFYVTLNHSLFYYYCFNIITFCTEKYMQLECGWVLHLYSRCEVNCLKSIKNST